MLVFEIESILGVCVYENGKDIRECIGRILTLFVIGVEGLIYILL